MTDTLQPTDDRRALLEAVAFGRDPDIRPADRLKALEMLADHDRENAGLDDHLRREAAMLSPEQIDAELDAAMAVFIGELTRGNVGVADRWPGTARAVTAALRSALPGG